MYNANKYQIIILTGILTVDKILIFYILKFTFFIKTKNKL